MSIVVSRSAVFKIPGIRPHELACLHNIEGSAGNFEGLKKCRVLSSKFEPQQRTYTVEISVPIEGADSDSYGSEWQSKWDLPNQIFAVLAIFRGTER